MWLVEDLGPRVQKLQSDMFVDLKPNRIELDETWSYVKMKERNVPEQHKGKEGFGDCYTWVAIDPETKLIPCWHVGRREFKDALAFIFNLRGRLGARIQLSTDGFRAYVPAIQEAFGDEVDYGWLIKNFGDAIEQTDRVGARYSPPPLKGVRGSAVIGNPEPSKIGTSIVERQNLTIRMHLRRFTRLTNAFSKKFENHKAAIALHFACYNLVRIHQTIRVTPAMEAGYTNRVWAYENLAELLS